MPLLIWNNCSYVCEQIVPQVLYKVSSTSLDKQAWHLQTSMAVRHKPISTQKELGKAGHLGHLVHIKLRPYSLRLQN